MTRKQALLFAIAVIFPVAAAAGGEAGPAQASAPCAQRVEEAAADLDLGYREFDQSPDRGWRRLRSAGFNREAIELIRRYLAAHKASLPQNQRANLNFHAAQVALNEGDVATALAHLEQATIPKDTSAWPLDWNSYVRATRAFVAGDRRAFDESYSTLTGRRFADPDCGSGTECMRRDGNADVVERLRRCWGEAYRVAYDCRRAEGEQPGN